MSNVSTRVPAGSGRRGGPIRVAMLARAVYPLHGFGGIERHVFHLVSHLGRLGAEVTLYAQRPAGGGTERQGDKGTGGQGDKGGGTADSTPLTADFPLQWPSAHPPARSVFLRYDYTSPVLPPNGVVGRQINYPWYSWELGRLAAGAVRRGAADVVHSQGLCATGYGLIRRRDPLLRRTPFVANPHGMEEFRTPDWRKRVAYLPFRALYALGHRLADRAIATDACTRGDLPRYLRVDPANVVVIPSAIDVEECLGFVRPDLRIALRGRLGLDQASLRLLSVGRLEQNKGFHVLIAALARLRSELPAGWRWLLVGTGSERERLEAQARAAGIAPNVIFVGRLDDAELHSLYEEVDLVIHPTLYEGSSLVTLEGMIHRRPLVASAAGGIPDKVFDERNGYLVRPGDGEDLAVKLRLALARRDRWGDWGEESVRIVTSTFAWPVVARKTLALYEELLRAEG